MKKFKTGQTCQFFATDEFTGKKILLTGRIIGNHLKVRELYPEECALAPEGTFLVQADNRSGFFVVSDYEINN